MGALENKTQTFFIFILGVAVGFGLTFVITDDFRLFGDDIATTEEKVVENEEAPLEEKDRVTSEVVTGENTLVVSNQPAGTSVIVSMIHISVNGWVAIHQAVNEEPGVILGAARFDSGQYFGEEIELLRATESEGSYMVVLHADDGDAEFDFKREIAVVDGDGNLIAEEFFTTSSE